MANGNDDQTKPQDFRSSYLAGLQTMYSNRFEANKPVEFEEERPSLSSYSQDIQDLLYSSSVRDAYIETQKQAMDKMLSDYGFEPAPYFDANPGASIVKVMRDTNFNGIEDKISTARDVYSNEFDRDKAVQRISDEYSNTFDNSLVFPDLGVKIDEYIPSSIREDDRKRGDFEKAFYQETGIALDFDGSNRVGDMYVEGAVIGNSLREIGDWLGDAGAVFMDAALSTSEFIYDVAGGDINKANEEFLEKQESGEMSTQLDAAEGAFSKGQMDLFWASFTSSEAREQLLNATKSIRRIDYEAMKDRGEYTASTVLGNSIDMLIDSAPLMLDLAIGSHGGSLLMKGATKAVAKKAASKVGVRTIGTRGGGKTLQYFDPKMPGKTLSKGAAQGVLDNANKVQNLLNRGGAIAVSDVLVGAQMHSDNVGQEWYDNLSGTERAWYLTQQSTAEVLSGMVLNNILLRGFGKVPKGKITQDGYKAKKRFSIEYGKNIARSTFLGIGEEGIAEAGTAAWQYVSEIEARKAGGDLEARYDSQEMNRRVKDAAVAGIMLGGFTGGLGGLTGGAVKAAVASFHPDNVEGNKTIERLAKAVQEAPTATDRKKALDRLQEEVKKRSGAQSALARAYFKLSESNPESFQKIAGVQGKINALVHQHKESNDPEVKKSLFAEIKSLVEEKQQLENDSFEGDTTFNDVYNEEAKALAEERGEKLKYVYKSKSQGDTEALAQKEIDGQLEEQRSSFEAAQAVNSQSQNTDDSAQDQEGETQADSDMQRNPEAPIEGVEGDANTPMSPTALEGQPLAGKYRDIVGRVNNLLRAFKPLGINAVVHTTEQSYFNATGKKAGKGAFKDGKTIHINLSNKNVGASTVRHEFLHAAFLTVSPQQKLAFYEELRSIYIRIGGANASTKFAEGIKKIEEAYKDKGYSPDQMLEEKIVTVLEQILDDLPTKNKQGIIAKIWRAIKKYIPGTKDLKENEEGLIGFVDAFRSAEREGTEFRGGRVGKSTSGIVESVDLGMNRGGFKSTAYPDLIRKKVTYAKTFINKMGGEYQLYDEVFVNDYWHFRNWWIKETGNGKRGDVLSSFTYVGENGQSKKINPPRPKVDKSTGEIVDMEPKLQTPFEMKLAANKRDAARRDMSSNRDNATNSLAKGILEVVGLSKTGGRKESRTELFIDSRGSETEGKSELPVVFSDTIFTEGLRNMEFQSEYGDAVRSTMEDFAFLVPKNQAGEFAYSIRNNGDGSVTIEAHSDQEVDNAPQQDEVSSANIPDDADLLESIDGVSEIFEFDSEPYAGSKLAKIPLSKLAGKFISVVGYDPTNYEGESGVYQDTPLGFLLSFSDDKSLEGAVAEFTQRAIDDYEERKKNGDESLKGSTFIAPVVMGQGSMLSNKRVCKELINAIENSELTDDDIKNLFDNPAKLNSFVNKNQSVLKKILFNAKKKYRGGAVPEGFKKITIGTTTGAVKQRFLVPVTKESFIEVLRDANQNGTMTARNEMFSFVLNSERGISSEINSIKQLKEAREILKGDLFDLKGLIPLIKEWSYELKIDEDGDLDLADDQLEVVERDENLAFPFALKAKQGAIQEFQPEKKLKWLDLMGRLKARTGKKKSTVGEEILEIESSLEKANEAVKNFKIGAQSRSKVDELYKNMLKDRKNKNLEAKQKKSIRDDQVREAGLTPIQVKYLDKLEEKDRARKTSKDSRTRIKSFERQLLGAQIDNELDINFTAESVDLDVDFNTSTGMPFNPNNMNSFQAFMLRMDQLFANKYANVMRMQKAIESAKGKVVDLSKDFINAEALLYGKTANDLDKLDGKVKDISLEMKDKGLNSDDVSEYLIARHAKERNAVISERTEGKDEAGSGMTNERADEIMNSLSPEKKAALESVAAKVDAITADTRKTMVDFGLEEKSTIDAFEAMFQNYVPLGGLALDEQNSDTSLYPTGGAGMSVYGDTTKRARGRKSEAQNVLAQAIAQNAAVHAKARKNEALSSLYKLVKDNPNPKVWRLAKEVPFDAQSAVGVRVNGEQQFIVFANPDMAKSLKNMGVEKLDLFSKAMRRFSGFLRRSFTTANPEFIISNFARDIQSAMFNAMAEADIPGGQIPGRHIAARVMTRVKQTLPALLKNAVGKDLSPEVAAYFEEFKEDGGQTGWGFVKDVGTIAAEIESEVNEKSKAKKASEWMARNSIEVIENVNDAFENSVRLAAYIEARKAGVSREKAAELAKNITVNFNRSGELGPMANAWYMFFNASVQGTVRLARSLGTMKDLRKPNGELESRFKRLNAAQKMAFGLSLTTGMLTMVNMAMSDDDEDGVSFYEKIPDYEKERNLIIMYSGKNYFKVPLPYGFNVFANLGTSMAEAANGQREPLDAGMFLLNSAFSSFSPISFGQSKDAAKYLAKGASPTILKPFVDIAVNETYFGSSVYREQFPVGAPKPQAEMSYRSPEGVRSFFQWMNEATGGSEQVPGSADFNPDKFWYGFEYYIGGAGQFITRSLGTGKDLFETIKEGKKVPMKANDFPFLRKLYGEASKYYDSDTYTDNANLVSQLYKERKEAEDKNDKRYKGVMKLESARKSTEKKIKKLRKLRKEARDIKNYVEKQNRIYELYEKERSLLMQFNKQYEQLRGKD